MKILILRGLESRQKRVASESDCSSEYDSEDDIVLAQLILSQNPDSEPAVETGPSDRKDIFTFVL